MSDLAAAVEDEIEEALETKALFCLVTGIQPSEYDRLTDTEKEAFIRVANRRAAV